MTLIKLREFYDAQPFQPLVMHLADGRSIKVLHREFMSFAPSGRTVVVHQPDDRMNVIDVMLVTDLEVKANGSRRRNKKTRP